MGTDTMLFCLERGVYLHCNYKMEPVRSLLLPGSSSPHPRARKLIDAAASTDGRKKAKPGR